MRVWLGFGAGAMLCACAQQQESLDRLADAVKRARSTNTAWSVDAELVAEYVAADGPAKYADGALAVGTVQLEVDLDRLVRGGAARLDARGNRDGSMAGSAFQTASSLSAPDGDQIAELWYRQVFAGDQLRLRAGVLDANTEFAALDSATGFFNSSAGTSPTIVGIPTWPATAPGVEAFAEGESGPSLGVGVYDGARAAPLAEFEEEQADLPSGAFLIGELGYAWADSEGAPLGRLGLGMWQSHAIHETFSGSERTGTRGIYVLGEQCLWRAQALDGEGPALRVFGLYGRADEAVAEAGQHLLAGLTLDGIFPGRPKHEVGLLISHVDLSDDPGAGFSADETVLEVQGGLQLSGSTSLRLSLQHFENPGGRVGGDELVLAMRFTASF